MTGLVRPVRLFAHKVITSIEGAQSGAGNLLCAITNLLNGGINLPLGFIVQLLNQILAILRL